ncbi:AtpZ/AtpI family protein [Dongia soli]|uniref:ATP synthase protein I n=1 Tax=Dongia soli TaxID=600628 RepID=A0ABU5ECN9_9PROT|nr:AtpZ/AtpI family protein [Dongia soli]MDY0883946.1 AtpZ/AtpI family protein [Dongia soli]
MAENDPERLQELDARLKAARERIEGGSGADQRQGAADSRMAAVGWRMSLELVVGIVVGLGLGWLVDYSLGSKPWFMIIFMFLGLAAGISNIMRTARDLERRQR